MVTQAQFSVLQIVVTRLHHYYWIVLHMIFIQGKAGNASRSPAKSVSPDKGGKKDAKKGGKKSPVKKEGGGNIDPEAEIPRGKCHLKKRGEEKEEPAKIGGFLSFQVFNKRSDYLICYQGRG